MDNSAAIVSIGRTRLVDVFTVVVDIEIDEYEMNTVG